MNLLKANPTNNLIRCALVPFRHITSLKTFIVQTALLALIIINIGQFISLLLTISVKTPYKYIYHIAYITLKELEDIKISRTKDEQIMKNLRSLLCGEMFWTWL